MELLIVGVIILTGFVSGSIVKQIGLPKVTGYILAGIILNPRLFNIIPATLIQNDKLVTNISLAFITFSVGGTIIFHSLKLMGKKILDITFFEAEFAFIFVILGMILISPFFIHLKGESLLTTFIPLGLLMGAMASPTDPSATLAIVHEYEAKGEVSSTIMGVAAFDDAFGIMNYSIAITIAYVLVTGERLNVLTAIGKPIFILLGTITLGAVFGWFFNIITDFLENEREGALIVAILAFLSICFGTAHVLGLDELLATMTMGVMVTNFNPLRNKIFKILERYTEELIFVVFFTLSGMHLNFSVIGKYYPIIIFFVLFRAMGKISGAIWGAHVSKASRKVKKYVAGGLIPQGGIVIGLALLVEQKPVFNDMAQILISTILGATVIHELIGPVISKITLVKAGEISEGQSKK